jgi:hypothetical protein
MIRLYTQVNMLNGQKSTIDPQEMRWKVTAEDIIDADKRVSEARTRSVDEELSPVSFQIFAPYKLEFVKTEWWSAYPIGQRLVNKYDVKERVFMAGGER